MFSLGIIVKAGDVVKRSPVYKEESPEGNGNIRGRMTEPGQPVELREQGLRLLAGMIAKRLLCSELGKDNHEKAE
jgi:hypothetical protein